MSGILNTSIALRDFHYMNRSAYNVNGIVRMSTVMF